MPGGALGSRAPTGVRGIWADPGLLRAQIGHLVDAPAIIASRAVMRDRLEAHPHRIADARLLDRRDLVVTDLHAAIGERDGAAGVRAVVEACPDLLDLSADALANPCRQTVGAGMAADRKRQGQQ